MSNLLNKWIDSRKRKAAEKKKKRQAETPLETLWSWVKTLVGAIIFVMIINGVLVASFVVPTGSMENTVMTGDFLFVNRLIYRPSTPQIVPFLNMPLPYLSVRGYKTPEKGDVIVFIFPGERDEVEPEAFQYYLKRCVATAGDTLEIVNNQLFINGEKRELPEHGRLDPRAYHDPSEKWRTFPKGKDYTHDNYGPIRIPKQGDTISLNIKNLIQWDTFIRREGHEVDFNSNTIYIDGQPVDYYVVERNYVFGMGDNRDHSSDSRYWGFIPEKNIVGSPLVVYWSWDTNIPFAKILDKLGSIRFSRIATIIR